MGYFEKLNEKVDRQKRIYRRWKKDYNYQRRKKNKLIITNTPEHGNLGDHALVLAEYNLFHEIADNYEIIEIPTKVIQLFPPRKLKKIVGNSPIFINAGGFLGTIWMNEEEAVRKILQLFPNNPIVVMPQTITYSSDSYGIEQWNISKSIYNNCKDISLFVRDARSVEAAEQLAGKEHVYLVPDMVIGYLPTFPIKKHQKNQCLLCLRKDKEKVLDDVQDTYIHNLLTTLYPDMEIQYTDTVIKNSISKGQRKEAVQRKLAQFASARLIITDRLHGMLFAAIAGTPCVVMNNANKKVEGVYQWIKDLDYISFINNLDELGTALKQIDTNSSTSYPMLEMQSMYEPLVNKIKQKIS